MNSPAVHSFSWTRLTNRLSVPQEKNNILESRCDEMWEWRKKLVALMKNRAVLQWMDFDITEYADIIFAAQVGNIRMEYDEESFDNWEKSAFRKQKESSLGDFDEFMRTLGSAKDTFHVCAKEVLSLLDETINITRMVSISPPNTVVSELQQTYYNYDILSKRCMEIFTAWKILIDTNKSLSSFSLDTIANLYNIRFFKNTRIARTSLNIFYRSEEVRLFLTGKPNQPKESPIARYQSSLQAIREKTQDPKGIVDALQRETNFFICQEVLGPRYIETIAEQADIVWGILKKYEKKIWKQEDILRKFNKMVASVDFSKDLLQVFVAIEHIAKEYGKNISILSDGYGVIKDLDDIADIIKKMDLLYVRIKDKLMKKIGEKYQHDPHSHLNPLVSVQEAIGNTHEGRGFLQKIYYALVRLVLEKDVFDEKLMAQIVASRDKTASIDWQNEYKASLHKSAEAKLVEYQKHPFYNDMVKTLERAMAIYIRNVEAYIKKFTDVSWWNGEEKETINTLLESIKRRIVEKSI